jgi:hypothetical protein
VEGGYSRTYCGDGALQACRDDLRASLARAVDAVAQAQGTREPEAWTYDKQQDAIRSSTLGLAMVPTFDFQNRPTFQQVASFTRSRTDAPSVAGPGAAAVDTALPARARPLPATGLGDVLPLAVVALLAAGGLHRSRRRRAG